MGKTKLYNVKKEEEKRIAKATLIEFLLSMFVFAIVLLIGSTIFKGFYVDGIFYAFIAAIIISFLDTTLRPLLVFLTLPVTIISMGILYPIVNVIILKLTSLLLGSHFIVDGIIAPFFLAIFISILKLVADSFIVIPLTEGKRY